jgi:membrane protease YdiL (CAAX protease family)
MPISGIILTAILKGMPGIIDQLKAAINIKAPVSEYLKIILLLVTVNVVTLLLAFLLFGDVPTFNMIRNETLYIPLLLIMILLGGPILEEVFGLRGYALPELLKKHSPLVSSLIVGFYFGAWHLVEFFNPGSTQYAIGIKYYPIFIITEIASSIVMTYFYLRNNKNLFLAGIFFHWMMNNAAVLFQTEATFSQMNAAPKMNIHYFIIYSVLMWAVSIYIVIKNKYYANHD